MNNQIKKEYPVVQNKTQIDQIPWPPVGQRTRSKTIQFYNQRNDCTDIFRFGKVLEKQSVFSIQDMK